MHSIKRNNDILIFLYHNTTETWREKYQTNHMLLHHSIASMFTMCFTHPSIVSKGLQSFYNVYCIPQFHRIFFWNRWHSVSDSDLQSSSIFFPDEIHHNGWTIVRNKSLFADILVVSNPSLRLSVFCWDINRNQLLKTLGKFG